MSEVSTGLLKGFLWLIKQPPRTFNQTHLKSRTRYCVQNKVLLPIYALLSPEEVRSRMHQMDNVRALYPFGAHIRLTEPLHYLRRYDCAYWLFDWLDIDLEADTQYWMSLTIRLQISGTHGAVQSECEHGVKRSSMDIDDVTFPVPSLTIRAVCEADFWHLSIDQSDSSQKFSL
jgi:hypothetical protein